jgi:hypothetical protein
MAAIPGRDGPLDPAKAGFFGGKGDVFSGIAHYCIDYPNFM